MNKQLLATYRMYERNGCATGIEATCTLMAAAIYNISAELELTDEQTKKIMDAISPEIDRLLNACEHGDRQEKYELVEYVVAKSRECKERMARA